MNETKATGKPVGELLAELLAELVVLEVRPEHRPGRGRFWRPGGAGYTGDPSRAGIWTRDTAPRSDRAEPVPALGLVPVLELAIAAERLGNPGRVWNHVLADGHAEERHRADDRASAWEEKGRIRWVVDFTPPGIETGAKVSSTGLSDTWEDAEAAAGDVIGLFTSGPRWVQAGDRWPDVRFTDQAGEGEILGLAGVPGALWTWRGTYGGDVHRASDLERAVGLAEAFFAAEVLANMVGRMAPRDTAGGEADAAIAGALDRYVSIRDALQTCPAQDVENLIQELAGLARSAQGPGARAPSPARAGGGVWLTYDPEDGWDFVATGLVEDLDQVLAELEGYRDAVTIQARIHEHGHELETWRAIQDHYTRAIGPRASARERAYAQAFDRASAVFETARKDGPRGRGEEG